MGTAARQNADTRPHILAVCLRSTTHPPDTRVSRLQLKPQMRFMPHAVEAEVRENSHLPGTSRGPSSGLADAVFPSRIGGLCVSLRPDGLTAPF